MADIELLKRMVYSSGDLAGLGTTTRRHRRHETGKETLRRQEQMSRGGMRATIPLLRGMSVTSNESARGFHVAHARLKVEAHARRRKDSSALASVRTATP
jgi:hypothetical protein